MMGNEFDFTQRFAEAQSVYDFSTLFAPPTAESLREILTGLIKSHLI
jgi:hypothetical protein